MLEDCKIRAFLAVVDEGGFTAAARRLGLSQPAVSAQIASLESSLGFQLFLRGFSYIDKNGQAIPLPNLERVLILLVLMLLLNRDSPDCNTVVM